MKNMIQELKKLKFVQEKQDLDHNLKASLLAFLDEKTGIFGNWFATQNALVYRQVSTVDGFNQDVCLLRLTQNNKTYLLGNSSRLKIVDTQVSFGKRSRNWNATEVQLLLTKLGVAMLPFDSFTQAGLKVTETKILDQSGSETVKREVKRDKKDNPIFEDVHFTGASLFQNGRKTFLFDIDREEIKHGIFNPFIVELPKNQLTIKAAYDSLVPSDVIEAQARNVKVIRQGEYFFIKAKAKDEVTPDKNTNLWRNSRPYQSALLQAQGNRAHECTMFNAKSGLVSGEVVHQGREHKNLDISDAWYKPVPNTAVRSFTLTGDVD